MASRMFRRVWELFTPAASFAFPYQVRYTSYHMDFAPILSPRFTVLYEDSYLLALDKPSGILTIPAPGKKRALTQVLSELTKGAGIEVGLHPCHRLDGETSGVLLFAKGKGAQKKMMELFHRQKVKKQYIAFVQGIVEREEGRITNSIEGKPAVSHFRVQERRKLYTVVEVCPETGRTNQIRLHFKALGHPLVGETRYAFRKDFPLSVRRLMLHAAELSFLHPWTGKEVVIRSSLPRDMEEFLFQESMKARDL